MHSGASLILPSFLSTKLSSFFLNGRNCIFFVFYDTISVAFVSKMAILLPYLLNRRQYQWSLRAFTLTVVHFIIEECLENSQQFDIKVEGCTSWDDATGTAVSVGQSWGKNNLSAFSNFHLRKALVPSPDHLSLADGKGKGPSPIAGGIEFADRIKPVEPSGVVGLQRTKSKVPRMAQNNTNIRMCNFFDK